MMMMGGDRSGGSRGSSGGGKAGGGFVRSALFKMGQSLADRDADDRRPKRRII